MAFGEEPTPGVPVYAFFRTKEPSPVPLFLHATFLLESNRDHIRTDDEAYLRSLVVELSKLLADQVLPAMVDQFGPQCLDFLQVTDESPPTRYPLGIEPHRLLRDLLVKKLSETPFLPAMGSVRTVAPSETKIWGYQIDEALKDRVPTEPTDGGWMLDGAWQANSACLKRLGASELSDAGHLEALQRKHPRSVETCAKSLSVVVQILDKHPQWLEAWRGLKALAGTVPMWWLSSHRARAWDEQDVPLFTAIPPGEDGNSLPIPPWLRLDVVADDFRSTCEQIQVRDGRSLWKAAVHHFPPLGSREHFLEHVVLPQVSDNDDWWREHGIEILRLLMVAGFQSEDEVPWTERLRRRVCQEIRVPGDDGSWHVAWSVYATEDWDGQLTSEQVRRLPDRAVLQSPVKLGLEDEPRDRWIALFRFLGVSWQTKIIPTRHQKRGDKGAWAYWRDRLGNNPFDSNDFPDLLWQRYVRKFMDDLKISDHVQEQGVGRWNVASAWCIDGLPQVWQGLSQAEVMGQANSILSHSERRSTVIDRGGPRGGARTSYSPPGSSSSLITWQLAEMELVPLPKPCPLAGGQSTVPINRCFVRSPGQAQWMRFLPRLDLSNADSAERRRELELTAIRLGAKDKIGDASHIDWLDWLRSLPRLGPGFSLEDAGSFMKACVDFSRTESCPKSWVNDVHSLEFLPGKGDRGIDFRPPAELLVVDDHRFEPLEQDILRTGQALFPLRLEDARGADRLFRVRLLSQHLELERVRSAEEPDPSFERVLQDYRPYILALVERQSEKAARLLDGNWPNSIVLAKPLQVHVRLDGDELGEIHQHFHWDERSRILFLSGEGDLCAHMARALVFLGSANPVLVDSIQLLLKEVGQSGAADANQWALEYLREKGITDAAIRKWIPVQATDENGGQNIDEFSVQGTIGTGEQQMVSHGEQSVAMSIGDHSAEQDGVAKAAEHDVFQAATYTDFETGVDTGREQPLVPPDAQFTPADDRLLERTNQESESANSLRGNDDVQYRATVTGEERREAGKETEEWVRQELFDLLVMHPQLGYTMDRSEGGGNKPFDLKLRGPKGVGIFVEVKRDSRLFYWSKNEVELAKSAVAYWIVLAQSPFENEPGVVRWIWKPLDQCRGWVRSVEWSLGMSLGRTPAPDPWKLPAPPGIDSEDVKEHLRAQFVIEVPEEPRLPAGWAALTTRLQDLARSRSSDNSD